MATDRENLFPSEQHRRDILGRSRLLREINEDGQISEDALRQSYNEILDRVKNLSGGKKVYRYTVKDIIARAAVMIDKYFVNAGFINASASNDDNKKARIQMAYSLACLGAEIGNFDDAELFMHDITQFVVDFDKSHGYNFFSSQGRSHLQGEYGVPTLQKAVLSLALQSGELLTHPPAEDFLNTLNGSQPSLQLENFLASFHPELDFDPGHKPTDVGEVFRRDLEGIDLDLPAIPPDFPDKTK